MVSKKQQPLGTDSWQRQHGRRWTDVLQKGTQCVRGLRFNRVTTINPCMRFPAQTWRNVG